MQNVTNHAQFFVVSVYPGSLIESFISKFSFPDPSGPSANVAERENSIMRISLPFKGQVSANAVRRHLRDLSYKICPTVQPVFVSRKLEQDFTPNEVKPSFVNQQCIVYHFSCDLCDAYFVGYTTQHLFQCVAGRKYSAISKHLTEADCGSDLLNESCLKVLKKCQSKFDCLVFEMLYIKRLKPNLNVQTDSIRTKLFV